MILLISSDEVWMVALLLASRSLGPIAVLSIPRSQTCSRPPSKPAAPPCSLALTIVMRKLPRPLMPRKLWVRLLTCPTLRPTCARCVEGQASPSFDRVLSVVLLLAVPMRHVALPGASDRSGHCSIVGALWPESPQRFWRSSALLDGTRDQVTLSCRSLVRWMISWIVSLLTEGEPPYSIR